MASPRLPPELMSPRVPMLSPHAISPSGGGHMVPVIAHTGYPPSGPPTHLNGHHSQQHTPPMYGRALHEPGMLYASGCKLYFFQAFGFMTLHNFMYKSIPSDLTSI